MDIDTAVKRVLSRERVTIVDATQIYTGHLSRNSIDSLVCQIRQLVEEPKPTPNDPDRLEEFAPGAAEKILEAVKPDESRLLTGIERMKVSNKYVKEHPYESQHHILPDCEFGFLQRMLKAQLAKCQQHEQARVEMIFNYFSKNIAYWEDRLAQYNNPNDCPEWQALKDKCLKQEGMPNGKS